MMEEAYKNYKLKYNFQINQGIEILCQEEFIHSIKTDDEFAKVWGVIVEVRELSMEERWEIANLTPNMSEFDYCNKLCDEYSVPTKSISLTYNNQTKVIYE
jgi:hypothetical protein